MKRIVVIGGGITGLASAYFLQTRIAAQGLQAEIILLEADKRLGGKVWTHSRDGFIMERGPDSFITQKPHAIQLCRELGLENELLPCSSENQSVLVMKRGKLYRAPDGFRLAGPTRFAALAFTPLFSLPGKIRMAMELFQPVRQSAGDESIADFVARRFGREALDTLAGPMMSGIFMGEADQLSMTASFPMLQAMEKKYGSLIKGFRAMAKQAAGKQAPPMFVSLKKGMQHLPDTLVGKLSAEVRNVSATGLRPERGKVFIALSNGPELEADQVINALPAAAAAPMLSPLDGALGCLLDSIPRVSSAGLNAVFRRDQLDTALTDSAFGFLVPKMENLGIRACTFTNSKFPGRTPEGFVLVRAFMGGTGREDRLDVPDTELEAETLRELGRLLSIKGEPVSTLLTRWPKANPQFAVGHPELVKNITAAAARLPGIHLACNGILGPGLPDRIQAAQQAAEAALQQVTEQARS